MIITFEIKIYKANEGTYYITYVLPALYSVWRRAGITKISEVTGSYRINKKPCVIPFNHLLGNPHAVDNLRAAIESLPDNSTYLCPTIERFVDDLDD